ncbi:hypothetical protein SLE2022_208740 [Rubroshorea leprosula]
MSQDENLATIIEHMMIDQDEESDAEIEKIENASLNDRGTNEENLGSSPIQEGKFVEEELKIKKKKRVLMGLRCRVEDAILGNYLLGKPTKKLAPDEKSNAVEELKETTLWGVPLLPSKGDEGTNIVLLKFLRAKNYNISDAFHLLQKTLKWRKEFKADEILDEELGNDLEKVVYLDSKDREGHPLYYNVNGAFKDKELYRKIFKTEENFKRYLRWRVQYIEKGIKELNFKNGGTDSIVQITDLKNTPRTSEKKAWMVLQENYPELIHRNIIINVPFWFYVSHLLSSRLKVRSHRSHSKFIFARPSRATETLLKFVAPENLPVEYGGLKREKDPEFSPEDKVTELTIRGNASASILIPTSEVGVSVVWDMTVVGWNVGFKEEFIPDDEGSYRILLQSDKDRKGGESLRNSFYINEAGKIMITIDNGTLKKKRVLYRYRTKPTAPSYIVRKELGI